MVDTTAERPSWRSVVAAAAAAERALAIVVAAGSNGTSRKSRRIVDDLWAVAEGSSVEEPSRLADRVHSLPELDVDDSDRRAYFAGSALEVLAAAASMFVPSRTVDRDFADAAADAFSEIDGIVDYATPRIIDPQNPPPPGRHEAAEYLFQLEDRELLSRAVSRSDAVRALRERSSQQRDELIRTMNLALRELSR